MGRALGAGVRAVWRERWLAAGGLAVALAHGALALPAWIFVSAAGWLGVQAALERDGGPLQVLAWALAAWTSPRVLALAAGLWLAGWLLSGALRVAWIAGAMPILAGRLSGTTAPHFHAGLAYRFAPAAGAAVVALALDLLGQTLVLATGLGALAVLPRAQGSAHPGAVAAVVAAAAVSAAFLSISLSVLGDATVVRAAVAGEGPGTAAMLAARRFLDRPAAFVAAALAVGLAALLAVGTLESLGSLATGLVGGAPPLLLAVPQLLIAALSGLLAAAAELWRLSALASLSLGGAQARPVDGRGAPAPGPHEAAEPAR